MTTKHADIGSGQLTVVSVSRRGVILGFGPLVTVPALDPEDKKIQSHSKQLIWDPEEDTWSYAYLSKGLPHRGETLGIGERGKLAYYKVRKATPTIIELQLVADQVFPARVSKGDFPAKLTYDAETFRRIREPTYLRLVPLTSSKHQAQLKNNPTLQTLFSNAKTLAQRAYAQFQHNAPKHEKQRATVTSYTEAFTKYTRLSGQLDAYRTLQEWVEGSDMDPRAAELVQQYAKHEILRLTREADEANQKVQVQRDQMRAHYPELRALAMRITAVRKHFVCPPSSHH